MRIRHDLIGTCFDLCYLVLMTNILLVIACLPMVAGLVATDPVRSWPLLAVVAPFCAPGLAAAFAVFSAFSAEHSTTVVRTFARTWRATWRPDCMATGASCGSKVAPSPPCRVLGRSTIAAMSPTAQTPP